MASASEARSVLTRPLSERSSPTFRDRLRVAVVGIGFGQQVHVPAFRSDERCIVSSICASSMDRARRVAERLGIAKAFGAWQDAVTDPEVDVVSVAVPPRLQPQIAVAAVAAGKHVFCEKPVAVDLASARRMLEAAERAQVIHAVDFLFSALPPWQEAAAALASGAIGRIRHVALSWKVETYAYARGIESWKMRAEDGGGVLNGFASHAFHYLESLLGPIVRVAARLSPTEDADALAEVWLEFAGGYPGSASIATDAFLGRGHRLEIYGDKGTLVLENVSPEHASGFTLRVASRGTDGFRTICDMPATTGSDSRIPPVARLVTRFVDAVLRGGPATPDLRDGARVQLLLDTARRAHRIRGWLAT